MYNFFSGPQFKFFMARIPPAMLPLVRSEMANRWVKHYGEKNNEQLDFSLNEFARRLDVPTTRHDQLKS